MNSKVLFITYDGLLDPLGRSQILPYLYGIARHQRSVHIISFEKNDLLGPEATTLRAQLRCASMEWSPLPFTWRLAKIGKAWDLMRMYATAIDLQIRRRFDVVHCRSYQAMQVGCFLKRLTGVRTIFDMRGLWVDERVDGGLWPQNRLVNRLAYAVYKRIERGLLACANHVVALTDSVVPELWRLSPEMTKAVTVIPCCADFDHFVIADSRAKHSVRAALGIPPGALVLSYLGSLGTWYMLEEMLKLFAEATLQRDDVYMLFITRDWGECQDSLLKRLGVEYLRDRIRVQSASREQVPALLGVSDIMVSFIKPTYSKMASSPTKLAEAFALGIPVISNSGVGDVERLTNDLDAGLVIDLNHPNVFKQLVVDFDIIRKKGGLDLRLRARAKLGLEVATRSYYGVYAKINQRA